MFYISVLIYCGIFFFLNRKIYKEQQANSLSAKSYMFGVLASAVILFNAETIEIQILSTLGLLSSGITVLHILYIQRKSIQKNKNDNFMVFIIALIGSSLGVYGSSQFYMTIKNYKHSRSSLSLM